VKKSDSLKWSEEITTGDALVDKERTYQKEQSNAIIDKQDVLTAFKYGTKTIPITGKFRFSLHIALVWLICLNNYQSRG
jgi:hypothetical protein